jgi:uncharacterized membrane protein
MRGRRDAGMRGGAAVLSRLPHPRFVLFLALFAGGTGLMLNGTAPEQAVVLGFDLGALGFLLSSLPLWRNDDLGAIRARGARDDGGRALLLLVSVIVLAAVLLALTRMMGAHGGLSGAEAALVVVTLVLAWLFVNLVYAFHYAHLFYDQVQGRDAGGLQFPGDEPPLFADFCYFSFVIGMTCQVSDVVIVTHALRRTALLHGVLAFFFNLGVLALTINTLSGAL